MLLLHRPFATHLLGYILPKIIYLDEILSLYNSRKNPTLDKTSGVWNLQPPIEFSTEYPAFV